MARRRAGVLLHPTSLPGPYGIGDLGPSAFGFVDFLNKAGQRVWQTLPLTLPNETGSPYSSASAFAGNWLLISPDRLLEAGWLTPRELPRLGPGPVRYRHVFRTKRRMLERAYYRFRSVGTATDRRAFDRFCAHSRWWLEDAALYFALHNDRDGRPWFRWPRAMRDRSPNALAAERTRLAIALDEFRFGQWIFARQWGALRRYARRRDVRVLGDLPFFVRWDSADVWCNRSLFLLDPTGRPRAVSGVPPDYFARSGQRWDDPQYRWSAHTRTRFRWWIARFRRALELYNAVRIDHFRGYCALWYVPPKGHGTSKGRWVTVPGGHLLSAVRRALGRFPAIAEDLGTITPDVERLRKQFRLPSTRVLQFELHVDQPHLAFQSVPRGSVVYTGTHDNPPVRAWLGTLAPERRKHLLRALSATPRTFARKLIRLGMESPADTFIAPLQDILNLGAESRMNLPGRRSGSWSWRLHALPSTSLARSLRALTSSTFRR